MSRIVDAQGEVSCGARIVSTQRFQIDRGPIRFPEDGMHRMDRQKELGVEHREQRLLDIGGNVAGLDADRHLDQQRDLRPVLNLEVHSRHPVAIEIRLEAIDEASIQRFLPISLDGDEHGVPATRPP